MLCCAIDVGATKIAAGLVSDAGEILCEGRVEVAGVGSGDALFERMMEMVRSLPGVGEARVCGIGSAGPISPTGEVSPLNIAHWRSFPLRRRVQDALGLETRIDLDAKALAVAEGWKGAAAGVTDYLAMVVSSGVGGGVVVDGRLLDGRTGNAGHVGHVVVVPDGHPCSCGGRGCLEAHVSGTAIARHHGIDPRDADDALKAHCGRLVGQMVAGVANVCDLDLAVVAGSVALGFGAPFFEAAQEELSQRARLDFSAGARIVPGGLGDRGPLLGAACVGFGRGR